MTMGATDGNTAFLDDMAATSSDKTDFLFLFFFLQFACGTGSLHSCTCFILDVFVVWSFLLQVSRPFYHGHFSLGSVVRGGRFVGVRLVQVLFTLRRSFASPGCDVGGRVWSWAHGVWAFFPARISLSFSF